MNTESSEKIISTFRKYDEKLPVAGKACSAEAHRAAHRCLKRVEQAVEAFCGRVVKHGQQ